MVYQIKSAQILPLGLEECWEFFSNPANLKIITPESMGFEILSGAEQPMYPGQIIQYHVSPIFGLKLNWVTEIKHVDPLKMFVDEQRYGPYAMWHHKHFFKPIEGGVETTDLVHYKLPLGILGRMAHPFLVKPKIEEIFKYRSQKLNELFPKKKDVVV
ncbi:MAG TPA: cell division inhibitor [Cytophagales bacterium]|jgi:ligand-binding SRPBCC domain-containing protein|nr:cell division inhibitor [Cytophagales bacterium]